MFHLSTRPVLDEYYLTVGLIALALVGLLFLGPGRSRTTPGRRRALVALRLATIVLIVLVMLRPTVVYTSTEKQSAMLIVLVDRSRSMTVADAFGNKPRWQALDETVAAVLPALAELAEDLEIKFYSFGESAEAASFSPDGLPWQGEPAGQQSAYGAVLEDVLKREAGKRLAAVILLGDGAQRAYAPRDTPPHGPARQLRDLGYPLYTVVFGQAAGLGQTRDVAVRDLLVESAVFVKNRLPITGSVRIDGFVNDEVQVQALWELEPGKLEAVDTTTLRAVEDGQQLAVNLSYVPQTPGEYRLTLRAATQRGELVVRNNELSTFVTVLAGGLNVLYLEGDLRAEAPFLRRALGQSEDLQVDFVRFDARRPETRPAGLAESFQPGKYNVYILGDIDSTAFTAEELDSLRRTVVGGAGLIALGGVHSFGPGGYAGTPLADILPVEMAGLDRQRFDEPVRSDMHLRGPVSVRPTAQGLRHFVMLLDAPERNAAQWEKLPLVEGANRLIKKPAATLLAESPVGDPLLIADNVGGGRVLAFAGDSTWHWPLLGEADAHRRFWRQIVLWLARKDQVGDGTVWVKLDQRSFAPGSRVDFTAGGRSPQGEPVLDALFTAEIVLPDGSTKSVRLGRDIEQWQGTFIETQAAGEYRVTVTAVREGASLGTASARFLVVDQDLELDNPAADPTTLANLATMTGGKPLAPEQLPALLEELKKYPQQLEVEKQTSRELYDNWIVFLLLVGLLTGEWFLRKKWGLV